MDDQKIKLLLQITGAKDVADLRVKLDEANEAGQKTGKGMGSLQQSITAAGYAFQDFTATSGDLGAKLNSVSNNLPTLLAGLGGLGTVIAVGATAGIAIYRSWDQIAGFWETRNPFPKAAQDVEGLKRELERAKDETKKLEEAGTGNARQLEKYNELRAKTAELEKKVADEQERQARLKKFLEGKSEEDEGRAKAYQGATAGRGGETLGKIEEAMRRDAEGRIASASAARDANVFGFNQTDATDEEKRKFAEEETRKFREVERSLRANDWGERAKELNDRLLLGEERAGKILDRLMAETGVVFDGLRERMDEANPVLKKKAEDAAKAAKDAQDKAVKAAKEARDRETDELNKTGQDREAEAKAVMAKDKKGQKAEADDLIGEGNRNEAAIDAETKKILAVVGKTYQSQYERAIAENAANIANGNGGVDPSKLKAQLGAQMVGAMRRRGAGEQAANLAARQIGNAGGQDLERRAADASANNLGVAQATLAITRQLQAEWERQSGVQRQLIQEVQAQGRRMQAGQRNARKR